MAVAPPNRPASKAFVGELRSEPGQNTGDGGLSQGSFRFYRPFFGFYLGHDQFYRSPDQFYRTIDLFYRCTPASTCHFYRQLFLKQSVGRRKFF